MNLSSLLTSSAAALLLLLPFFEVSLYPPEVLCLNLGAARRRGGYLRNEIKAWG